MYRHDAEFGTIATTNLPFGKFNQILRKNGALSKRLFWRTGHRQTDGSGILPGRRFHLCVFSTLPLSSLTPTGINR